MRSETPTCQLTTEPFYQCCCNCVSRLTDYKSCAIHGHKDGQCVCSEIKGYICVGDSSEGSRAHSEWPEHSVGCEGYLARAPRAEAIGAAEYASWFGSVRDV